MRHPNYPGDYSDNSQTIGRSPLVHLAHLGKDCSATILAKIEGLQAGCQEALMLNHQGLVAECTGDNIFVVRRGVLLTPGVDSGILEGVTREAVMELAREAGVEVRETSLERHDVYTADECFLTGTAAEVIPVVKVDSRVIGSGPPGPMTNDLRERFHKLVRAG